MLKSSLEFIVRNRFPPVLFACGYGSGVFKQATMPTAGKMVDTIFVVEKASSWHGENINRNPTDYAFLPKYVFPTHTTEKIQRNIGGSMWFNTLIECETERKERMMMKYGVISLEDLLEDCTKWTKLYVAGRLQKPVLVLDTPAHAHHQEAIEQAIQTNRQNALKAALAITGAGEKVSIQRLLEEIVGLSYGGDVRVGLAESPTKVVDITKGSFNELQDLYIKSDLSKDLIKQVNLNEVVSTMEFSELVSLLPPHFNQASNPNDLRLRLSSVVRSSSFSQTLKGFLTAGMTKSVDMD